MDGVGTDYATLKVVGPKGFYKSCEPQCEGGMVVGRGYQYVPGKGKKGELAEIVRRNFSDRLRQGDAVELVGYPMSRDRRIMRVVREGRVVDTVAFMAGSGGRLEDSISNCAGF